jgi:hypothetical protein
VDMVESVAPGHPSVRDVQKVLDHSIFGALLAGLQELLRETAPSRLRVARKQ